MSAATQQPPHIPPPPQGGMGAPSAPAAMQQYPPVAASPVEGNGSLAQQPQMPMPPVPPQQQPQHLRPSTGESGQNAAAQNSAYNNASLYVGDLAEHVSEPHLYDIFNVVGPVASIRLCRDGVTRRSLGYAYVNYHSPAEAERALETFNFTMIEGQPCRIMWSHRDPALRKSGNGNLYVKNLDKSVDQRLLYDTFSIFGNILSCKVQQSVGGESRGFGFVHFETEQAAQMAIEKLNGVSLSGKPITVCPFVRQSDRRPQAAELKFTNLYVKSIPPEWTEEKLMEIFGKYGEITSVENRTDDKGRRFALINYAEHSAAQKAIEELHQRRTTAEGVMEKDDPPQSGDEADALGNTEDAADTGGAAKDKSSEADSESTTEKAKDGATEGFARSDKPSRPSRLYVSRFQSKSERVAALHARYNSPGDTTPLYASGSATPSKKTAQLNLFVKNLDDSVTDERLQEAFSPFGTITSAKVMKTDKGQSKGFGFVCFQSPEEATKACSEMHLKMLLGKPMYVNLAEKKEQRKMRLAQRFNAPSYGGPHGMPGQPGGAIVGWHAQRGPHQAPMYGGAMGQHMAAPFGQAGYFFSQQGMRSQGPRGAQQNWHRGRPPPPLPHGGHGGHQLPLNVSRADGRMTGQPAQGYPGYPQQKMPDGAYIGAQGYGSMPMANGISPVQGMNGDMSGPSGPAQTGWRFTAQVRNRGDPTLQQYQQPPPPQHGMAGHPPPAPGAEAAGGLLGPPRGQDMSRGGDKGGGEAQAIDVAQLARYPPSVQKQILGEKLFPRIQTVQPQLAGKITGMMLEMENSELIMLLESEDQLSAKIDEALRVLEAARQPQNRA